MKGLASRPVPENYRGVWQRSLLQTDSFTDTSSIVFWLQTASWYADIRIPSGRPDFHRERIGESGRHVVRPLSTRHMQVTKVGV